MAREMKYGGHVRKNSDGVPISQTDIIQSLRSQTMAMMNDVQNDLAVQAQAHNKLHVAVTAAITALWDTDQKQVAIELNAAQQDASKFLP